MNVPSNVARITILHQTRRALQECTDLFPGFPIAKRLVLSMADSTNLSRETDPGTGETIKCAKRTLCFLFAYLLKQELPCDLTETWVPRLIRMRALKKLRVLCNYGSKRAIKLAYSLQNCKALVEFSPDELVQATLQKHAVTLSTPFKEVIPDAVMHTFRVMTKVSIDNIVRQLEENPMDSFPQPTDKACHSKMGKTFSEAFEKAQKTCRGKGCENLHVAIGETTQCVPDTKDGVLDNTVVAVPLVEALKVRVITKEAAWTHLLKPVQKVMHASLRDPAFVGMFRLTNSADYGDISLPLEDDEYYLSGDYTAATDALSPWFLEYYTQELRRALDRCGVMPEITMCLRAEARMHRVEYHKSTGIAPVQQQRGQLMGSLLSFPVLCLANAATVAGSHESALVETKSCSPISWGPLKSKLLINGDDVLWTTSMKNIQSWRETAPRCGLALSIGKNFISRKIATVNSQLFIDGKYTETFKFKCVMSEGGLESLASTYWNMTDGARAFKRHHAKKLRLDPRALDIAISDGGLGFGSRKPTTNLEKLCQLTYNQCGSGTTPAQRELMRVFGCVSRNVPDSLMKAVGVTDRSDRFNGLVEVSKPPATLTKYNHFARVRKMEKLVKSGKVNLDWADTPFVPVVITKLDAPLVDEALAKFTKRNTIGGAISNASWILPAKLKSYAGWIKTCIRNGPNRIVSNLHKQSLCSVRCPCTVRGGMTFDHESKRLVFKNHRTQRIQAALSAVYH